jgi:GcrA cell cycle regulator
MTASWTHDRVEILTQLWTDGLSASEVARKLGGVTRNAVIGKLHRLGLLGTRATASAPHAPRPSRLPKAARARAALPRPPPRSGSLAPAPPCPQPQDQLTGTILQLTDLRRTTCRWPIGDPQAEGFSFCGRRATRGPYCGSHAAVAYQPRTTTRRQRVASGG